MFRRILMTAFLTASLFFLWGNIPEGLWKTIGQALTGLFLTASAAAFVGLALASFQDFLNSRAERWEGFPSWIRLAAFFLTFATVNVIYIHDMATRGAVWTPATETYLLAAINIFVPEGWGTNVLRETLH